MMENTELLIKTLRLCGNYEDREGCAEECPYFYDRDCPKRIMIDAADALEAAEQRIADLEAQLPKEGVWIELDKIKTYCSNCNWASYSMLVQKDAFLLRNNKTKYCPNCGARMRGVNDE